MNENEVLLTICIVNHNSSDFIEVMLESLQKLTLNPYTVLIRDNNSTAQDLAKLAAITQRYNNVVMYQVRTNLTGSMDHGAGLNDLVQRIATPYGVIMDADAVFLMKNWDQWLIARLTDHVPIYGTQADIGGGKPQDFPLMFAVAFRTDILTSLEIDFRPKDIGMHQDTGWEIREKYMKAGYAGGLLYSFSTRVFTKGPFADVICTEYYAEPDASGQIIASHFGRGSAPRAKRLIRFTSGSTLFHRLANKILSYASVVKWRRDKNKWLAICRSILSRQEQGDIHNV